MKIPLGLTFRNVWAASFTLILGWSMAQRPVITNPVTEPYDISTSFYAGASKELDVSGQSGVPAGLAFNDDGTKLFVIGFSTRRISVYNLATAYDVSTSVYAGLANGLDVGSEETQPTGLAFNNDGTKLFIVGFASDAVITYNLSAAYDVSTGVYAGAAEELSVAGQEVSLQDLTFNNDGTKLFVIGVTDDAVVEYDLSVAYDVSTGVYAGAAEELSVAGQETFSQGLTFNNDGTKLFVIGNSDGAVVEYNLSVAYDVSTGVYAGVNEELDVSAEDINPGGLAFDPSGTQLFVVGFGDDAIVLYNLASSVVFAENSEEIVIDVDANDGQGGATDGSVTYGLEGTDASLFSMDALGQLRFNEAPNFENPTDADGDNAYRIIVVASTAAGETSQGLIINVMDVDDTPVFTHERRSYDVSTGVYAGEDEELGVAGQESSPRGLTFNNDGTKLFVIGSIADAVVEYDLSVAYDVSTSIYAGAAEELSVGAQESIPTGLTFNNDGTKLFVIGESGDAIVEYDLSVAYDVSTGVYAGAAEELSVGAQEPLPTGLTFNDDGTKLLVIGTFADAVVEYDLSVAYDVSTGVYAGAAEELRVAQEGFPTGLTFNDDGTKLFVIGGVRGRAVAYDLNVAYDVSTGVYAGVAQELSVRSQESSPEDLTFNNDGTKLFVIGAIGDAVVEYTIRSSVAFAENSQEIVIDVDANDGQGGATDASVTYGLEGTDAALFSIDALGQLRFNEVPNFENPTDAGGDNSYEVTIVASIATGGTAQQIVIKVMDVDDTPVFTHERRGYDVSTAVYAGFNEELSVAVQESIPTGLTFNNDGTKLFMIGSDGDAVVEYDLSVVYDVSTGVYAGATEELSVGAQESAPTGLTFNNDGTKLFVIGATGDAVVEYNLSVAYDVSTSVYAGAAEELSVGSQENNPQGLTFNDDGTRLFVIGEGGDAVVAYDLSVAYDVSTGVYAGEAEELSVAGQESGPTGFTFNNDGTKLLVIGRFGRAVVEYDLGMAYDVSSAIYTGINEELNVAQESAPTGLTFNNDGTKLFVIGTSGDAVVEYDLATSVVLAENSQEIVIDVDANDGQGGATDASVTYELEGTDAALFSIDATGQLRFNESPNFEAPTDADGDNVYEVTVVASIATGGTAQRIVIDIVDVNDTPVFTNERRGDYDVSTGVYAGASEELSVAVQESVPTGLTFNNDGTKLFVIGTSGDAVVEYDLSVAYDVSMAVYAGVAEELGVGAQESAPTGLTFNDDGTKLFVIGTTDDSVAEYDLSVAYDVSTGVYAGAAEELSVAGQETSPTDLTFNDDGTKLLVIGSDGNAIVEYDLSVAYDVSTGVYAGAAEELSVAEQEFGPQGLTFNSDGTKLFVIGTSGDAVVEYDLSVAYDVSTGAHAGVAEELSVGAQESSPQGLTFNNDGTKLFVIGIADDAIVEYDLASSVAFAENSQEIVIDVDANDGQGGATDASVTYELEGTDAALFSIDATGQLRFNNVPNFETPTDADGDNTYKVSVVASNAIDRTAQRIVIDVMDVDDTPVFTNERQGYDVSTGVYAGVGEELNVGAQEDFPRGLTFNNDGTKLFVIGTDGDAVVEYDLSVAYDVATSMYAGAAEELSVGAQETFPTGLTFNDDGTKLLVIGTTDDAVVEYDLSVAYDVSTGVYAGAAEELNVAGQETSPTGLTFNDDGTKLLVIGSTGDAIVEYDLSVAYDVSTGVYAGVGEELRVASQESSPTSLTFNNDGTKLFVIGESGDAILEYDLRVAYDVSSAVYAGINEELNVGTEDLSPQGLVFNADGTQLFVIGLVDDAIVRYDLATSVAFAENSQEVVIDVDANDGQGGATDASVTYQLEGTDAALFGIDATGQLRFSEAPNFENPTDAGDDNSYEVTVVASNAIDRASQRIVIDIMDVDDTPVFTNERRGYDVSTGVYTGAAEELRVASQEDFPQDLTFNNDGTKLFVIGTSGLAVVEYDLSVAYDVATSMYAGAAEELDVASQESIPTGLAFNNDGTKLFVIGTADDAVVEYDLSVAYDVSTGVYAGTAEELSVVGQESSPTGLTFNDDGTKLFVIGDSGDAVVEYDLSVAYDVSTGVYAGSEKELRVASQEFFPSGLTFNNDGTKLLVIGFSDDAVVAYNLSVAYNISSAVYAGINKELNVRAQESSPTGLTFNNDGTKLFVIGVNDDAIVQYDLAASVAFAENSQEVVIDVDANDNQGGATDESVAYELEGADASIFSVDATGQLRFNEAPNFEAPTDADGDNSYEVTVVASIATGGTAQRIVIDVMDVNDAPVFTNERRGNYDVAAGVYAGVAEELSVRAQESNPLGLTFNHDGTKLFVIGSDGDAVVEYDLSVAYDVSTGVYAGVAEELSVGAQESSPQGLTFNNDGTKLFVIGSDDDAVVEYNLGVAYDVSTGVYTGATEELRVVLQEFTPSGLTFNNDGTKLLVIGAADDAVVEYNLSVAYDVSTGVYAGAGEELRVVFQESNPTGLTFNNDGTKLFVIGTNENAVVAYDLSVAYDVSTGVYAGEAGELGVAGQEFIPTGLTFNNDGTQLFVIGVDGDAIIQYDLATSVVFAENSQEVVIDIDANDGQGGATDASVTYELEGTDAALFGIDATGNLTFTMTPDFENPGDADTDNNYEIIVVASNSNSMADSATQIIVVEVRDVDENAPVFTSDATVSFAENGAGVVYTAQAEDESTVTFTLGSSKDETLFALTGSELSFIASPDFETPADGNGDNVYEVDVIATDAAGNSSTLALAVTVTNVVDEEAPVFTSDATVSFAENGAGVVYTAQAEDESAVTFTLGTSKDETLFTLTGAELSFVAAPDFETPADGNGDNVYEVDVIATDAAGNSTTLALAVTVTNVDDTAPVFTSDAAVSFAENGVGVVYTAQAEDESSVTFTLGNSKDETLFALTGAELSFIATPDFETPADGNGDNVYEVDVIATDAVGNSSTLALAVTVTNVDDTAPVFTSDATVSFAENGVGVVYTAQAEDESTVTFTLGGSKDETLFALTGAELSFIATPDFETPADGNGDNVYEVDVIATDAAGNSSTLALAVTVTNVVDEEAPVFTSDATVSFAENGAGIVYTAQAEDESSVTFTLGGSKDETLFALTGAELSFIATPDFETPADGNGDNVYEVDVIATDAVGNSSTLALAVTVTNVVDEEAPVFISDTTVSFAENGAGIVYTAQAEDESSVTFALGSSKDETLFALTDAELSFVAAPDFETPLDGNEDNVYVLDVIATDMAGNVGMLELSVTVTDADEIAPEFTSDETVSFAENGAGVVYMATANESATFGLGSSKDEGLFRLTSNELRFIESPDFETPADGNGDNIYVLDVTATDAASNASTLELRITVTDVDDDRVLSVEEVPSLLVVYPNPVKDVAYLNISEKIEAQQLAGKVTDFSGKMLGQLRLHKGTNAINVTGWVEGTYLVSVVIDGTTHVVIIIKQ